MSPRIQLPAAVHAGAMAEAMDVDLTKEDKGKAPAAAPSFRKSDFDLPWVSFSLFKICALLNCQELRVSETIQGTRRRSFG